MLCACGSSVPGLDAIIAPTPYMMTETCIPCLYGTYSEHATITCSFCSDVPSQDATGLVGLEKFLSRKEFLL